MNEIDAVEAPQVTAREPGILGQIYRRLRLCGRFGLVIGVVVGLLYDLVRQVHTIEPGDAAIIAVCFAVGAWIVAAVYVLMTANIPIIPSAMASFGNALVIAILTVFVLLWMPRWPIGVPIGMLIGALVGNVLCAICCRGKTNRTSAKA